MFLIYTRKKQILFGVVFFAMIIYILFTITMINKRNGSERTARSLMYNIVAAQFYYKKQTNQKNFTSNIMDFKILENNYKSIPDLSFIEMQKKHLNGYRLSSIKITSATETNEPTFSVIMYPEVPAGIFRTGNDCFYIDQTWTLRHSGSPTVWPDANSPPVQ